LDRGVRQGLVDAWPHQIAVVVFDPEAGVGAGVEQQFLFKTGWIVLQIRDGVFAQRDALAGQLLVVGQQIALTDQQTHR
jgi:hypothetical protein